MNSEVIHDSLMTAKLVVVLNFVYIVFLAVLFCNEFVLKYVNRGCGCGRGCGRLFVRRK